MKKLHATLKALCNCNEEMIAVKRPIGFYRFSQCPRMAAGLLALAFLSPIAACSSKGSLDDLKNPTPSRSTSSFKPSTSASIASDTPTWNFPVNLDGWRMDIIDRDGKNRAINSAGCYLTTSQRPIAGPQRSPIRAKTGWHTRVGIGRACSARSRPPCSFSQLTPARCRHTLRRS